MLLLAKGLDVYVFLDLGLSTWFLSYWSTILKVYILLLMNFLVITYSFVDLELAQNI